MVQFCQGGENEDAVAKAQREIDSVRGIMTENIERVLERGERIDLLVDKTAGLEMGAREFRVRSRGLRRRMWWKNTKVCGIRGVVWDGSGAIEGVVVARFRSLCGRYRRGWDDDGTGVLTIAADDTAGVCGNLFVLSARGLCLRVAR